MLYIYSRLVCVEQTSDKRPGPVTVAAPGVGGVGSLHRSSVDGGATVTSSSMLPTPVGLEPPAGGAGTGTDPCHLTSAGAPKWRRPGPARSPSRSLRSPVPWPGSASLAWESSPPVPCFPAPSGSNRPPAGPAPAPGVGPGTDPRQLPGSGAGAWPGPQAAPGWARAGGGVEQPEYFLRRDEGRRFRRLGCLDDRDGVRQGERVHVRSGLGVGGNWRAHSKSGAPAGSHRCWDQIARA